MSWRTCIAPVVRSSLLFSTKAEARTAVFIEEGSHVIQPNAYASHSTGPQGAVCFQKRAVEEVKVEKTRE